MITFEQLKRKGYIIEVNTTGAMIVDTIDAEANLKNVSINGFFFI